jgi:hypothetical protein
MNTLTTLAYAYNVHINTLKKWIGKYPEIELDPNCRVLTPKQLEVIYDKIGNPNIDDSFKRKPPKR